MNIIKKLLTKNQWSRPGTRIKKLKALVIHWVANPKTSAIANINYFESRKDGKKGYGSAHYFIDLNGDTYQCIPDNEVAYNCGSRMYSRYKQKKFGNVNPNNYTIGIELCHLDWEGSFSDETFDAAVELCANLCNKYNLNPLTDITTHQAVVGWKNCPKWFFDHPEDFQGFKEKVYDSM
jgi:N-acetylmuramoyl-L-alanine amidase